MAKFNTKTTRPAVKSPVASEHTPTGRTHQGGAGHARDTKSELFLLAVANMVGENTFYETAADRDSRYQQLVRQVAVDDITWLDGFIGWLRGEANMRTASLVAAAEAAKARLEAGLSGGSRQLINAALQRADEPGELLAYWTTRYGRAIPKPVKRGVADAVHRLYSGKSLLKYDTASHGFRFADVIDLVHPSPAPDKPWQGDLFAYTLERRHGRDTAPPESNRTLTANARLLGLPVAERRGLLAQPDATGSLAEAGFTWEMLAGWLQGPMDAQAWSAVIPSMGYMALLRNLRNFDEAGVPDSIAVQVAAKLSDPERVARSRQLPMRFVSAYRAAPSLRWSWPLEQALGHSLANIPTLPGRTLILVDTSGSMHSAFSKDGTLMRWDAAVLFGIALGQRCAQADVVSFSSHVMHFPLVRGESLLTSVERWRDDGYFIGGGTDTGGALRTTYQGQDRVVIVTDEQAAYDRYGVEASIPANVPMYTWNLAGYRYGHAPSGNGQRHTFGGLTDAAFRMIPLLEAGRDAAWPWMDRAER